MLLFIAYILSLFQPKALSDAVNNAESSQELDAKILEMAGFENENS